MAAVQTIQLASTTVLSCFSSPVSEFVWITVFQVGSLLIRSPLVACNSIVARRCTSLMCHREGLDCAFVHPCAGVRREICVSDLSSPAAVGLSCSVVLSSDVYSLVFLCAGGAEPRIHLKMPGVGAKEA